MPFQVVARESASQLLRSERVAALQQRIAQGDFDAVHYESTPRRRAEILAQVLNRCLSRSAMRRRLKSLGVSREYCGGTLKAISVEGGGLDVQRSDGKGQVVTGPGLDAKLLGVFPELLGATLWNIFLQALPGASYTAAQASTASSGGVFAVSASNGVEAYDLSLFLTSYTASAVGQSFTTDVISNVPGGFHYSAQGSVDFNFISKTWGPEFNGVTSDINKTYINQPLGADAINWVQIHAEQSDAVAGSFSCSATGTFAGSGFSYTTQAEELLLLITYTDTGCDTCDLTIQVNSACDGSVVSGGTFSLDNGQECTQDGSGTCTISGIPHGDYDWTWTKTGYQSQSGTYTCECVGGSSEIFIDAVPDGGCPPNPEQIEVTVTDYCTEEDLSGVLIVLDAGEPEEESCITEAEGVCYFENVAEGTHTLTISKDDYQSQFQVVVKAGTQLVVSIALFPDGGCEPPECRGDASVGPMRSLRPVVRRRDDRIAVGPRRSVAPVVRAPHA